MSSLASALNLDPAFLGIRPAIPQHLLLSDDVDDMDEDILSSGTLQCEFITPTFLNSAESDHIYLCHDINLLGRL